MNEIKYYLNYKDFSVGSEIYLIDDNNLHVIKEIFVKDDEVYFRVNKIHNIDEKPDFLIREHDVFDIEKSNMISVEDSINIYKNLTSINPYSELTLSTPKEKINFNFATKEIIIDRKFNFNGKTHFKKVPQIITIVDITRGEKFFHGTATCDKIDYNERDGILNAIANAVCGGNFDKVYDANLKAKEKARLAECKCSMCGGVYNNPEDARSCEKLHIENKKRRSHNHWLKTEAKRRYKKLCDEGEINAYIKKLAEEDANWKGVRLWYQK